MILRELSIVALIYHHRNKLHVSTEQMILRELSVVAQIYRHRNKLQVVLTCQQSTNSKMAIPTNLTQIEKPSKILSEQ